MDVNRDGVVTLDEFLDCCRNDDAISRSMAVFDTSFWHDVPNAGATNPSDHSTKSPALDQRHRIHEHRHHPNHRNFHDHRNRQNGHHHRSNGRHYRDSNNSNSSNNNGHHPSASNNSSVSTQQEMPDPSLVKVKSWYTVAKQGVSC